MVSRVVLYALQNEVIQDLQRMQIESTLYGDFDQMLLEWFS